MIAIYADSLTVPPNTPEATPARKTLSLGQGLLRQISIMFPDGTLGAVGVRVSQNGRPFLPQTGWLRDNNKTVSYSPFLRMEGGPYLINLEGYSLASDWPHTIYFTLEVGQ